MAVRIAETSFGTKRATINVINKIQRESPEKFERLMFLYWKKVYEYALQEVPKDTRALMASIRIRKGKQQLHKYAATYGDTTTTIEYYITAGGEVVNPKHRRIVDYAKAVHDGYMMGNRWHSGNPFLERAFQKAEAHFSENINEYMDWIETEWQRGAIKSPPTVYFRPQVIIGGWTGEFRG